MSSFVNCNKTLVIFDVSIFGVVNFSLELNTLGRDLDSLSTRLKSVTGHWHKAVNFHVPAVVALRQATVLQIDLLCTWGIDFLRFN